MSSSNVALAPSSTRNQEGIVPYYGRNCLIVPTDVAYQKAVDSFIDVSTSIANISITKNHHLWTSLSEELGKFSQIFLDPDTPLMRYQLEILVDSIIPYLQDVKTQIHTQPTRFTQIQDLLKILSMNDVSPMTPGTGERSIHPCHTLLRIESVIVIINRERGFFKSKLSTALESGVRKQWAPIISDHQQALMSIGGKLCILGLVEAVGRPIIMLYPLFVLTKEALKISTEIETKKKISLQSIIQIGKMLVMLFAVSQLLGILSMYRGLGYTCLALGSAAVFVGCNHELTKSSVPVLAPHMVSVSLFLEQLCRIEGVAVAALSRLNGHMGEVSDTSAATSTSATTSSGGERTHTSSRVTELPRESDDGAVVNPLHVPSSNSTVRIPIVPPSVSAVKVPSVSTVSAEPEQGSVEIPDMITWTNSGTEPVEESSAECDKDDEVDQDGYVFAERDMYNVLTARQDDVSEGNLRRRRQG